MSADPFKGRAARPADGSLLESQMFHNGREVEYPKEIEARVKQFTDGGWTQTALGDKEGTLLQ